MELEGDTDSRLTRHRADAPALRDDPRAGGGGGRGRALLAGPDADQGRLQHDGSIKHPGEGDLRRLVASHAVVGAVGGYLQPRLAGARRHLARHLQIAVGDVDVTAPLDAL